MQEDGNTECWIDVKRKFKTIREAFWWLYTSCSLFSKYDRFDVDGRPRLAKTFYISESLSAERSRRVAEGSFVKTECGQGIKPEITKKNEDIDPKTFVGLN